MSTATIPRVAPPPVDSSGAARRRCAGAFADFARPRRAPARVTFEVVETFVNEFVRTRGGGS